MSMQLFYPFSSSCVSTWGCEVWHHPAGKWVWDLKTQEWARTCHDRSGISTERHGGNQDAHLPKKAATKLQRKVAWHSKRKKILNSDSWRRLKLMNEASVFLFVCLQFPCCLPACLPFPACLLNISSIQSSYCKQSIKAALGLTCWAIKSVSCISQHHSKNPDSAKSDFHCSRRRCLSFHCWLLPCRWNEQTVPPQYV